MNDNEKVKNEVKLKEYESAELIIIEFAEEDIITTSGGDPTRGEYECEIYD